MGRPLDERSARGPLPAARGLCALRVLLAKDGKAYAVVIYTRGAGPDSIPARAEVIHDLTAALS